MIIVKAARPGIWDRDCIPVLLEIPAIAERSGSVRAMCMLQSGKTIFISGHKEVAGRMAVIKELMGMLKAGGNVFLFLRNQ